MKITIFILTIAYGCWSWSQGAIAEKLEKILKSSGLSRAHLSIFISSDPKGEESIFAVNPKTLVIPASVSKLVTSAMVLEQIPPGSKFKTQLLSEARNQNGHLAGEIYLKGGGDPSFVSENMWVLVNNFLRTGIKAIDGDIIVDDSLFDQSRFDSSRQEVRVDRAYDAPTGAMSFNWNSVNVFIRPGKEVGESALVFVDPENEYTQLKAEVKTVKSGATNSISVEREARTGSSGDLIVVKGKIAIDSKEVTVYKNITRPDLWSGFNLKSFLKQRGIEVKGQIRNGKTPDSAAVLAEVESKPIELILADMNKFSNNYVAEMLAKNAAAKVERPGTIAKAMDLIKILMARIGLKSSDYEIKNPSGLTRDNRLSAFGLWKVLNHLKNQFQVQPELMTSLPIGGIDGTLKKRFKDGKGERQVRAKTGFLTGVVSLAGYLAGPNGTSVPFVMMYNGSDDEAEVRAIFDKMCLAVIE